MQFEVPEVPDPSWLSPQQLRDLATAQDAARVAYREHNRKIRPLLPHALQELQDIDMSDAKIRSLKVSSDASMIQICYVCGDTPRGYFDVNLKYEDIDATHEQIDLLCMLALEKSAEIYWTEIDLIRDEKPPRFIHRCRWNTNLPIGRREDDNSDESVVYTLGPEIEFRFGNLEIDVGPRKAGRYVDIKPLIESLPDSYY
jgi:hypothetical protein